MSDRPQPRLALTVLRQRFTICRLEAGAPVPPWASQPASFASITRTATELSIVAEDRLVPSGERAEHGWRALRVEGPLAFDAVGVMAAIAVPLAGAGVSMLPIGTFDTDYVFVRDSALPRAVDALRHAGHEMTDAR